MKAGLPNLERDLLARWQRIDLYAKLRARATGREKFILHDGPPYANGHIHIGTAVNKILKDIVTRAQQMLGKDSNYVPGWDCHGLPIEWQVEQRHREAGRRKEDIPLAEFRRECRAFAEHWIGVQRDEFRRLGVVGDWDHPYTTMSYAAEAQIAAEILKFLMSGALYRGAKPVLWSVVEKTALAEAEVEYQDHTSTTIHVRFRPLVGAPAAIAGASLVIWTTTPWTIPGNRGIAFSAAAEYVRVRVLAVTERSLAIVGEEIIIAEPLLADVCAETGIAEHTITGRFAGAELEGARCAHPWRGAGYDFDVEVHAGDFVAMEQGTGLVHIAPGHGTDDYNLGLKHGLEVPHTVGEDGTYLATVPLFGGHHVFKVDRAVADKLAEVGALLARGRLVHSYPHSWRSKTPLILRNTPQWFISMTATGLRDTALAAIKTVRWLPPDSRNRIEAMVADRTEWVLSRQRAWGVPIPLFVHRASGEPLRDPAVHRRVVEVFAREGADAWFGGDAERFLGPDHKAADYEMVQDIAEVWFDSGATHAYVLEQRADLRWPASLYLEGTDQHRGWFQSSLLEACGTRGRAPFEAVLTHGFVLDGEGRKMSKSLGNVIAPQEVSDRSGAEILRVWVASSDYTQDLRIGADIIQHHVDAYRKVRNTLRYILGNLAGFAPDERVAVDQMPELERLILHRLHELDRVVRQAFDDFDFHTLFNALYTFCTVDLSAFYFDVRKDLLYCDALTSPRRRAARTVLDELFSCLTAWLAPVMCFTTEEAWLARWPSEGDSVHLRTLPEVPAAWRDDALGQRWDQIRAVRRVITGALEIERQQKRIGSSLLAGPRVWVTPEHHTALEGVDLAEVAITSTIHVVAGEPPAAAYRLAEVPGVGVTVALAEGTRCERCWRVLPEVGAYSHADLCGRCEDVLTGGTS
ncbi:MAG: isoleucine--tRNA ligase [Alphaproteobacteria bacterium]|nr:isoleucine--tRNA ligase [Alphaproteobacteria bacterium]